MSLPSNPLHYLRRPSWPFWVFLLGLTFWFLGEMILSIHWRIAHDQAPLFYEAYLMRSQGYLPYRDFFDFQMPGTYLCYYLLGWLSGFSDLRIRILDLGLLLTLLGITFFILRPFGLRSAWLASVLFGLNYLQGGPSMALQREYLMLLPVAIAIWMFGEENIPLPWRAFLAGAGFGLAATIKPHAAIGLPAILLGELFLVGFSTWYRILLPVAAGFSLPILIMVGWLGLSGTWSSFWEITRYYWPLYARINGEMRVIHGKERWLFILQQLLRLGGNGIWFLPASLGVVFSWKRSQFSSSLSRRLVSLIALLPAYAIYPAFSGQFFDYHWLPFVYVAVLLAALAMEEKSSYQQYIGLFVLCLAVAIDLRPPAVVLRQLEGKSIAPLGGRVDRLAGFLEARLKPGDTVQPLDWTGGTLHAMLIARARLATPFVFDFYFYHHVSNPYIQSLRRRFLDSLQSHLPRFIIEITAEDKPWVSGTDTSRDFPELRAFLRAHYRILQQKEDYVIYELR